ncbi:MAG: hypothetical protein HYY13_05255 [Nitrospirae bacterium]|nr:hypothetical protein [Nitrospirota bacterium]
MPEVILLQEEGHVEPALREFCKDRHWAFSHVSNPEKALQGLQAPRADVYFVCSELARRANDVKYPPLSFILTTPPRVGEAIEAMQRGAFDYILRPVRREEVELKVERALDATRWLDRRIERILNGIRERRTQLHRIVMSEVERVLIRKIMERTHGNKLQASSLLGINRNTLHKKVREYRLG